MRLLDRYVLRNFLEPFLLCFSAFLGILLIFDLNDNLTDFVEAKAKWKLIGIYYIHQLPHFCMFSMPLGLLLALLYCLSKMSRSNEVITMLTSGRSVMRVIAPLLLCGLIATGVCMWLNYELAPRADAVRKADIERITKGDKRADKLNIIETHLAKDRMTNRVWFTRKMQMGKNDLEDAHITQINARGEPVTRWYAKTAVFDPRDDKWLLIQGRKVNFDNQGNIAGEIEDWSKEYGARSTRVMKNWSETPYRIASSTMEAEQLTVPQLRTYLAQNADFPEPQLAAFRTHLQYRWALPLTCLSVVFIAAPLGIVFSRRAVLASVASSIFIFFGYLFLMFLMLALGKGNHVSPLVAGWLPNALLLIIGCYLLFLRSTNRDLPKISFRRK